MYCILMLMFLFFSQKGGITQNSENDSPVWVPDSDASTCMHCKKSQFSLINRKVGYISINTKTRNKGFLLKSN